MEKFSNIENKKEKKDFKYITIIGESIDHPELEIYSENVENTIIEEKIKLLIEMYNIMSSDQDKKLIEKKINELRNV